MSKESIPSSNLKAIYDWKLPAETNDFNANDIANIITQNNLIFNSLYEISDHLADPATGAVSTKFMPAVSIGSQHNILTHDESGSFSGDDIMYFPQTKSITNWAAFFDLQINFSQNKNKSTILLTNKEQATDDVGWMFGVNGAGFLFFRFKNKDGNQSIKTFTKRIPEKCLIAISKSIVSNSLSIYIYDTILHKIHEATYIAEEAVSLRDWSLGGPFTDFASDSRYEKLSGEINHFVLFDIYVSKEKALSIFESFFVSAFTAEHTEDVATEFDRPGKYVETEVRDGMKIDSYVDKEVQITTNSGETITVYEKTPIYVANMVKKLQFINGVGKTTKMIPTIVPETKTKDNAYAKTYANEKCILLDSTSDVSKITEVYSCDDYLGNMNKTAKFMTGDSTFKLDKVYANQDELQIYLNGLLLEKDIDYEINDQKIKKLQNGVFVESDTLIYDVYEVGKTYYDFFGYNGNIYLYGESGKDVYLNGKKLVKDIDYLDYDEFYLQIHGQGLPQGRLGIVERYNNITQIQNFTGKYLQIVNYVIFNEITWIDGEKVVNGKGYSLTTVGDLNNSEYYAPQKATKIYDNEEENFTLS